MDLDAVFAQFAEQGFARLGPVAEAAVIEALGARVDALMLGRAPREGIFFQLDAPSGRYEDLQFGLGWEGPSPDYRKLEKLENDPLFLDYLRAKTFETIARRHVGGPVSLYRAVVFNKSARGGSELPFHQDGGAFWGVDLAPTLQIWTALDDAEEGGGCLEVIPGSHRAGLVRPSGGVVPRPLAESSESFAIPLPARAGEVILVHNHLWHRSRASTSGRRRAALSVCYMSARTRCLRTRSAPREFLKLFD